MRKWTWVLAQLESSIEVLYSFDRRAAAVMECRSGLGAGQKMAERPQVNLSTNASKVPPICTHGFTGDIAFVRRGAMREK
jgi:hypothetical protein